MKKSVTNLIFSRRSLLLICFFLCCQASSVHAQQDGTRRQLNFDFGWKFQLEDTLDAKQPDFDDSKWRTLDLPHDWSIEQPFDLDGPAGWRGAYLPGGTGWYRKTFDWSLDDTERVFIRFDGVYMHSDVYINGHHLGNRPYGYISFEYDLSPYLKEGRNVVSVRVDNSKLPSGRWYTGSGIYRHVKLAVTGRIHIPQWGTFVSTPRVSPQEAEIRVLTTLENHSRSPEEITLQTTITAPGGARVTQYSASYLLDTGSTEIEEHSRIARPVLWSPDTPVRYRMVHRIWKGDELMDEYTTWFGIRSVEISAADGFVLNGEKLKLRGVSNHHDAGPVGAAVPEDVLYRRLKLLKAMGCNAIRTTHNPAAPEFYTMCDTLGFLVLDEAFDGWDEPKAPYDYGLYFKEWWRKDLSDFIRRDRNHPSVVMWSIGNEVPDFEPEQQKQLVDLVKSLDPTRAVTQGRGASAPYIDVAGFNGEGEIPGTLEKYHRQHPEMPLLGTEMTHTLQTRGVYATRTAYRTRDFPAPWEHNTKWENFKKNVLLIPDLTQEEVFKDNSRFYQSSYDNAIVRMGIRDLYNRVQRMDYLIGTFRWSGFDYLGEATIQPARTANFGILDLCGFPKDHYYLYQSLWSSRPMVHLLPHWTHPGKEGTVIPVVVYTNAESAELFLNGKSLGTQQMDERRQLVWKVPYQAGTLKAIARNKGKTVAETEVSTAGDPAAVQLLPDKAAVRANKRDVIHVEVNIVDRKKRLAPESENLLDFEIRGPGKIIGVENGDITDFSSMKDPRRKAFKGKCLVMIQSTGVPGKIQLKARSKGLKPARVDIISR